MFEYIIENKEWIFSGIGVAVISWFLLRKSKGLTMSQKGGKGSTNIQVGGDFSVSPKGEDHGDK